MAVPLLQIDAFTDAPFRGNPAAVCLLDGPREAGWMQAVAAEMNLAETAFLVPVGDARYGLRWFTPTTEVALCGHATLASAHALWTLGREPIDQLITFDTLSGALVARPDGGDTNGAGTAAANRDDGRGPAAGHITIDLPAREVSEQALPEDVARAIGVTPSWQPVWTGATAKRRETDYLVVLASEREVRAAAPDIRALRALPCGVIVTARAETAGTDVASRYFVPYCGIDEDPVTGSAHCALATYWARELGRTTFVARQVSAREGLLGIRLDGDRVHLTGRAVTVLRGELVV